MAQWCCISPISSLVLVRRGSFTGGLRGCTAFDGTPVWEATETEASSGLNNEQTISHERKEFNVQK